MYLCALYETGALGGFRAEFSMHTGSLNYIIFRPLIYLLYILFYNIILYYIITLTYLYIIIF